MARGRLPIRHHVSRWIQILRIIPRVTVARGMAACLVLVLLGTLVVPSFWHSQTVNAFSNLSQSNWSGGIGTSPSSQYASSWGLNTGSTLTLDQSQPQNDWCNTTNCGQDWEYRKPVNYVNDNDGDHPANGMIEVVIFHDVRMKSDFSDLRFADKTGDVELPHYIYTKEDNVRASILVQIPQINADDLDLVYVYFGNSSATSTSDDELIAYRDTFASGSIGSEWVSPNLDSTGQASVENGVLSLETNIRPFNNYTALDRSVSRTYELDVKLNLGYKPCDGSSDQFEINFAGNKVLGLGQVPGCVGSERQFKVKYVGTINETPTQITNSPTARDYIRIKYVALASGGTVFYVSTDGGVSFTKLDTENLGETNDIRISFFTYDAPSNNKLVSIKNVINYVSAPIQTRVGQIEYKGGHNGILESVVYDLGSNNTQFGNINITRSSVNDGDVGLYVRTGRDEPNGINYNFCGLLNSGYSLSTSLCGGRNGDRYLQYMFVMSSWSGSSFAVSNISIEYLEDSSPPNDVPAITIKKSESGSTIAENGWTNSRPYFSWNNATDNSGGTGIAGYCIYLGTDSNGDPANSDGIITQGSPLDTHGACTTAITAGQNWFNSDGAMGVLNTGETYYFRVRAIDQVGLLSSNITSTRFRYDADQPYAATLFTFPSAVNSPVFNVSWLPALGQDNFGDNGSGVAGIKYCITSLISGLSGCDGQEDNWFGPNHGSGRLSDASDVFSTTANQLTTSALDAARIDDAVLGYNAITVAVVDNAGNARILGEGAPNIFRISYIASDAPEDLTATPTSNNANSFSFSWEKPTTLYGNSNEAEYCWTVNDLIEEDGNNCNWTGKNIYTLAQGPYATKQGTNTLYMATRDVTGNFDGTKYTSTTFTTSTIAPGVPQDLDISDVSIRATSNWRLALSWTAPNDTGSGISKYKILRSLNGTDFTLAGSTSGSNTSFIDSGLDSELYYYKIQACDNADSCGVAGTVASRKPTGRYTEPAKLTADTDQPKQRDITTRKATILWYTDRESDSRVAIGTSSGNYFTEEIGNSEQTSNHVIKLTNLEPGTTYYYVAKWTDGDGNTGQSIEHTFRTLPAPSIGNVETSQLSVSSALVSLKSKQASKISLYYGTTESFGDVITIDTSEVESSYSIQLTELLDGTKYFFKLNGYDIDGNEYQGNIYSFTTPARPVINSLAINTVEGEPSSTKKITWRTNVPTNSLVTYSPKGGKEVSVIDSSLTTNHAVTIKQLLDDTEYSLVAKSSDAMGNNALSETQTFRTALDTRAPKISDINIESTTRGNGADAKGQIVVSWRTDEPATSQLAYGQGETGSFSSRSPQDERLTTEHTMILSDLSTASIYRVEVVSQDKAGNSAISEPETAIIGRPSENVFTIILTALQNVFGVNN